MTDEEFEQTLRSYVKQMKVLTILATIFGVLGTAALLLQVLSK